MIRVLQGDITKITGFDAIVNPANNSLLGGGGLNGVIHRAAGPQLKTECRTLNGCETGDSKLTLGYNLPCTYIIHSVGPVWMGGMAGEEVLLSSCYVSAMKIALENKIRKIAFSSISTGEYGYPLDKAAKLAIATVSDFIAENPDAFDDICWVVPDELSFSEYSAALKEAAPKKTEPKKKPSKKSKVKDTGSEASEDSVPEDQMQDAESTVTESSSDEASGDDIAKSGKADGAATDIEESDSTETSDDADSNQAKSADSENSPENDDDASGKADNAKASASDAEASTSDDAATKEATPAPPVIPPSFPNALFNKYHIDWLIDELANEKPHTFVCFWLAEKNSEFCQLSQWYKGEPIFINGRRYNTATQYVMSEKALLFGDFDSYTKIMTEEDPAVCEKLGLQIKNFDETVWKKCSREILFNANVGKYRSDKFFADALMSTGDAVIIEANPTDDICGAGMSKKDILSDDGSLKVLPQNWHLKDSELQAKNDLGFILMAVREFFKKCH